MRRVVSRLCTQIVFIYVSGHTIILLRAIGTHETGTYIMNLRVSDRQAFDSKDAHLVVGQKLYRWVDRIENNNVLRVHKVVGTY